MDKTRILPGELLVSKGALKINSSLPEVGLKDVLPNGSWLEQKQIQASLEARKQLIEVERIEKSGVLSHAEWHEDLMLAEVTQKVGGYWQYLGHNVGKKLFLKPEEALFLMEVNCLLLKYNEVKVSLQQAYALLLRNKISLMQYKVYASLSRLGYRVFRHKKQPESQYTESEKTNKPACSLNYITNMVESESNSTSLEKETEVEANDVSRNTVLEVNKDVIPNDKEVSPYESVNGEADFQIYEGSQNLNLSKTLTDVNETLVSEQPSTSGNSKREDIKHNKMKSSKFIQHKINKLTCRKIKTKLCDITNDYFKNIPDFTKNPIFEIKAPDRRYLPGKINLKNNSYRLNIEKIQTKSASPEETTETLSSPDDNTTPVCQNNVNQLRPPPQQNPRSYRNNNWTEYFNFRFASQSNPFRQFNPWRPQTSLNYFQLNMTFQRPFMFPQFGPRVMLNPFIPPFMTHNNLNPNLFFNGHNSYRKRRSNEHIKQEHYASIQRLANFIKNSMLQLRVSDHNLSKLNHLIQMYNTRYKTRLRLSNDFTVITEENIIDTIEVDDDDEPTAKKAKKDKKHIENAFDDRLEKLKELAYKLKNMEMKNEATSRQRRMFSNMIRAFNTSYKVDYYVNDNCDIVNRNDLTMLLSSDSDSVSETSCAPPSRKKLKNPFSILKQLSEKQSKEANQACTADPSNSCPFRYSELTIKTFKKDWLPEKSDFGRAEIVSNDFASEVIDMRREEFLFDFLKIQPDKFKNWLDIKISFLQCLQETCELFQYDERQKDNGLESLVKPEEFNDASLVLKKLSIFKNNEVTKVDASLGIDFDVYNRNVQHFKKSNRPLPHFRVICIRESSTMPSGEDVASLHSQYKDDVTIIFAVVGSGSISYLQVNPIDLPVYISSNNTVS